MKKTQKYLPHEEYSTPEFRARMKKNAPKTNEEFLEMVKRANPDYLPPKE